MALPVAPALWMLLKTTVAAGSTYAGVRAVGFLLKEIEGYPGVRFLLSDAQVAAHQAGLVPHEKLPFVHYASVSGAQGSKRFGPPGAGRAGTSATARNALVYMDVGLWGGGLPEQASGSDAEAWEVHRDFGIAHGPYVVLCSLNKAHGSERWADAPSFRQELFRRTDTYAKRIATFITKMETKLPGVMIRQTTQLDRPPFVESFCLFLGDMHVPPVEYPAKSPETHVRYRASSKFDCGEDAYQRAKVPPNDLLPEYHQEYADELNKYTDWDRTLPIRTFRIMKRLNAAERKGRVILAPILASARGVKATVGKSKSLVWLKAALAGHKLTVEGRVVPRYREIELRQDIADAAELRQWADYYVGAKSSPGKAPVRRADIFQGAAEDLARWVEGVVAFRDVEQDVKMHVVQVGDMLDLWIGLNCFWKPSSGPYAPVGVDPPAHRFVQYWVNELFNTRAGRTLHSSFQKLQRCVESGTKGGEVHYLYGNHDNYLGATAKIDYTIDGEKHTLPQRKAYVDIDGIVYAEHGCQWDAEFNGNHAPLGGAGATGFFLTPDLVMGRPATLGSLLTQMALVEPSWTRGFEGDAGAAMAWLLRKHGERVLEMGYAVDRCLKRSRRIYVMGHTHSAALTEIQLMTQIESARRRSAPKWGARVRLAFGPNANGDKPVLKQNTDETSEWFLADCEVTVSFEKLGRMSGPLMSAHANELRVVLLDPQDSAEPTAPGRCAALQAMATHAVFSQPLERSTGTVHVRFKGLPPGGYIAYLVWQTAGEAVPLCRSTNHLRVRGASLEIDGGRSNDTRLFQLSCADLLTTPVSFRWADTWETEVVAWPLVRDRPHLLPQGVDMPNGQAWNADDHVKLGWYRGSMGKYGRNLLSPGYKATLVTLSRRMKRDVRLEVREPSGPHRKEGDKILCCLWVRWDEYNPDPT